MSVDLSTLRSMGYRTNLPAQGEPVEQVPSSFGQPVTNSFFGINYMQTPLPVPMNKDHYGLTFFTRPQLNLQTKNMMRIREMFPLITTDELSVFRAIRCMLDPRLQLYSNEQDVGGEHMGVDCRLIDPLNPFMPLLTNHLVSLSGFPDKVAPVYRSPEGQYREVHSMVDGTSKNYSAYNISATFRNSRGDPVTKLFDAWITYATAVFEGLCVPYVDYLLGGLIDYNTRIYRVTLDPSKRYVSGIAACGAAFPLSSPKGQQYDYNIDKPYNDANNQITIQFEANGAIWDDDILVWQFNALVGGFHPLMRTRAQREANMVLVPAELANAFNCRAYPRIDPHTRMLEWWVSKEYYSSVERETEAAVEEALDRVSGLPRIPEQEDQAPPSLFSI